MSGLSQSVEEEEAGRSVVRRRARGMNHHEAEAALEQMRADDGAQSTESGADDHVRQAQIAEWERIVELLADHEGVYELSTDAFLQGQLTAQANRETAEPADQAADEAHAALRQALARAGVMDVPPDEQEAVAVRLASADPEAATAVADWIDAAFAAGRAHQEPVRQPPAEHP